MNTPENDLGVLDDARYVVERSRWVHIDDAAVERTASQFAEREIPVPSWNAELHYTDGTPRTANYLLLLDGLNFSFWGDPRWGIEYKGQKLRGYWALAAALKRAIEDGIPVDSAAFMAECSEAELRHILRGNGDIPLLDKRLAHMHELGNQLLAHYGGQFTKFIEACDHSAVTLTKRLVKEFPSFDDTSPFEGRTVKLYKRCQILPADLYGAFGGKGWGEFKDIGKLTAFADYKVPQVLEKLGILRYEPSLEERIAKGIELPHGSAEEVELRAATIWGVELLQQAMARHGRSVIAIEVDWILWEMGLHLALDDKPYHLTRTTAY